MENEKRILIVEDSPTVIEQMKLFLSSTNIQVFNAGSEFGMLQSIEPYGQLVDLIIMDLTLKSENGMDLIQTIRANDKYSQIPIIIVTEHAKQDLVLQAKKFNVASYIKKPITKDNFLNRIGTVLGQELLTSTQANE